ncbi:MAG: NAD(+)/NADH kinase [Armatimonadota bacterium]|nr:NAD(+)/NADH kinase [Armatimonadota bacterium]MDR7400634.1 NAD(+)/NADH kinase [Armatimonadota bacterium]MDR7403162.1 NAD(+)/NADH kinase [Armatimonadota bacterium]MDR7436556.1 NAD(+)/NADH kinase [Armatimonadota bacterium]MDR7472591.1 NAD(+)/NADH kinase [Armatimonadota bacterium]
MTTVAVVVNATRLAEQPELVGPVRAALEILRGRAKVRVDRDGAQALHLEEAGWSEETLASGAHLVVAVGGDGTILRAARLAAAADVPILGVNLGGLGFLSEVSVQELPAVAADLAEGRYSLDERMMLQAEVGGQGRLLALNDVVVSHGGVARVLRLRVWVNGEHLASYPADGVIVATPTGSTAYSLSAGGPVVHPRVEALLITPICPHTFNARAVVVHRDDVVEVEAGSAAAVTADGRATVSLEPGQRLRVCRAEQVTRFVRLRRRSFYGILRTKLTWGER